MPPFSLLKEGDLVLWYNSEALPTCWPVGIITKLISGSDAVTRATNIQTPSGEIVRPLVKVIGLSAYHPFFINILLFFSCSLAQNL